MYNQMRFKFYNGSFIEDVETYIKDYVDKHKNVEVFIGTDSAKGSSDGKAMTIFVTTICFRHPSKGVHYIYSKTKEPKDKDLFTKIWKEVEKTNEVASFVKPLIGDRTLFLDLDINSLKQHGSNVAHAAAKGYLMGQGYSVRLKPQSWGAHAADWLLR